MYPVQFHSPRSTSCSMYLSRVGQCDAIQNGYSTRVQTARSKCSAHLFAQAGVFELRSGWSVKVMLE